MNYALAFCTTVASGPRAKPTMVKQAEQIRLSFRGEKK
jgi:hypothetical protein